MSTEKTEYDRLLAAHRGEIVAGTLILFDGLKRIVAGEYVDGAFLLTAVGQKMLIDLDNVPAVEPAAAPVTQAAPVRTKRAAIQPATETTSS